jgi:hypothetical protein
MQNEVFEQLRKVKIIGETALLCKKIKKNAYDVIDTGCTMRKTSGVLKNKTYISGVFYPDSGKF